MITFNIAQWRAWAPGLASAQEWQRWSLDPAQLPDNDQTPDVSFLPAMQRRRLGRMARMAFTVGWPLAEGHDSLPLVFVSRHGETPRTFDILCDLAADEPLSPTQFSLSVHNSIIGLWSIMRGSTCEMTALAAAGDGLEHGALEAATLLAEGAPAVLLIVTEEQPPPGLCRLDRRRALSVCRRPAADPRQRLATVDGPRPTRNRTTRLAPRTRTAAGTAYRASGLPPPME